MDVSFILDSLNEAQREAVCAPEGSLLVLAGAGSGKTRVLTHRVAWLVQACGISPLSILAVTFTNKAAQEMRGRIEHMLGYPMRGMWMGTFHSIAHRLLRAHWQEAGLEQGFQILDSDDQLRMIKRALKELNLDEGYWPPRQIQWYVNGHKEEGRRPQHVGEPIDPQQRELLRIYKTYEQLCARFALVDFAELLLRAFELIQHNEPLRVRYQQRFQHILVDEFQDTNAIQYGWLKLFAAGHGNIFIVGDDDQCLSVGTKINMADGSIKTIEQIRPGDKVLSGNGRGNFRAATVRKSYQRCRSGVFVTLKTQKGRRLTSTPEHTHFAGYLSGESPQMHVLYLMFKQGIGYRLGTSQVCRRNQTTQKLDYMSLAMQEHADALWIIRAHSNHNAACVDETTTSGRYGIPTQPFPPNQDGYGNRLAFDSAAARKGFARADTHEGAKRLLQDVGLDDKRPHHIPRSRSADSHNIVVTLCGDGRGGRPLHRVSIRGKDKYGREAIESLGLSVSPVSSDSWRFEAYREDFSELWSIVRQLHRVLRSNIILNARLLSRSLPFMQASSIRPGMVVFTSDGQYDVVEAVEMGEDSKVVCDLDIKDTHNFIANGIVTHNSIYGWRGARVENILQFEKDFPGTMVVRLEQNYRSTANILSIANAVIDQNQSRLGKNLWTRDEEGEPVRLYVAYNEMDEARFVVDRIRSWVDQGNSRSETAILYRSNAQSRVFEEVLLRADIPYRVYGGLRFFERAEIKDALAYLRLIAGRQDDPSFERIVNMPARGIGNRTLEQVRDYARVNQVSLWDAARALVHKRELSSRATTALSLFLDLIERLAGLVEGKPLAEQVEQTLHQSGLLAHFSKDTGEKAQARVENLEELITATRNYEHDEDHGVDALSAFLSHAALESGEGQGEEWEDCVQLMSLHSAKGLEFPLVFLTGLEEGLFPHQRSLQEPGRLEEERRLCYVGMTRAMKMLYISYAQVRHLYGREAYGSPSRFLGEIPSDMLVEVRSTGPAIKDRFSMTDVQECASSSIQLGKQVRHRSFGEGVVLSVEGRGEHTRVQVNFETVGNKWLVLAYANLEVL